MNALTLFVLKSTVVSGIFCTWYMLALKNRRLHTYNRAFLLITLVASIGVPLLHLTWPTFYEGPPLISGSTTHLLQTMGDAEHIPIRSAIQNNIIDWTAIVISMAALVSLGLAATMLIRISWVLRLEGRYPRIVIDGITLVQTDLEKSAVLFFEQVVLERWHIAGY